MLQARNEGPLIMGAADWNTEIDGLIADGLLEQAPRVTVSLVGAYSSGAPLTKETTVAWLTLTPKGLRS